MIILRTRYGHYTRILHWCTDQAITTALAQMDLTASQGRIMGFLAHQDQPPCSRDIEEVFHMSHPTVSGLLSRLEKKGFIEFCPDEADRRVKRIFILPKGRECLELMHDTIRQIESQMVQDFTPEEQEQFSDLLIRAIRNMGGTNCHRHKEEPKT